MSSRLSHEVMNKLCFCLLAISLILQVTVVQAFNFAPLVKILEKGAKHSDDMAKFGEDLMRGGKQVLKQADKDEVLKYAPRLVGQSDDVLRASKALMDFCKQGERQVKFVSALDNPVVILQMEKNMPGVWKVGDEAAEIVVQGNRNIPPQVIGVIKKAGGEAHLSKIITTQGNYEQAVAGFVRTAERGGKGSIETVKELVNCAKKYPKTAAAIAASPFIAWYMIDPEGASETIAKFVSAPIEMFADVANKAGQKAMDKAFTNMDALLGNLIDNVKTHWGLTILAIIALMFCLSSTLRKIPGLALNRMFAGVHSKLANVGHENDCVSPTGKNIGKDNELEDDKYLARMRGGRK